MKILYIAQRLPYPPNRGDRIPTFNHIRHLSQSHEVYVAALLESPDEAVHVRTLGQWAKEVIAELQPGWRKCLGMVQAFMTNRPLSLGHFHHPVLKARITKLIREQGIEAVIVFSSSMAAYVEKEYGIKRVMNFCDMDSQKWFDLSQHSDWMRTMIYRREATLLRAYEQQIALSFTANCVVTEQEAELFKSYVPGGKVSVVPNGVSHEYFGAKTRQPEPCELVFIGMMDYAPNVEAVTFFVKQVWQGILRKYPKAVFKIVGARPTQDVKALAQFPGVHVTGFVADVRDYLARATLVVIPLQVARGIQNKILEALAAGAPVLATPVAAEGLLPGAEKALRIVPREAETFKSAILQLLSEPETLHQYSELGRAFVLENYCWQRTGEQLEALLY